MSAPEGNIIAGAHGGRKGRGGNAGSATRTLSRHKGSKVNNAQGTAPQAKRENSQSNAAPEGNGAAGARRGGNGARLKRSADAKGTARTEWGSTRSVIPGR